MNGCKPTPKAFWVPKAPRFQDIEHMKVVRLQPNAPAAFTPQDVFLVLIYLRSSGDRKALSRLKILVTLKVIEPASFGQCLNQLGHLVPPPLEYQAVFVAFSDVITLNLQTKKKIFRNCKLVNSVI